MIKLYSSSNCAGCIQVKGILEEVAIEFQEFNISTDAKQKEFILSQGHRSVPVLYKDNTYVATGATQIIEWIKELND